MLTHNNRKSAKEFLLGFAKSTSFYELEFVMNVLLCIEINYTLG